MLYLFLGPALRNICPVDITSPPLQNPRRAPCFPYQMATKYGAGSWQAVLVAGADAWNLHTNVRGVTLV